MIRRLAKSIIRPLTRIRPSFLIIGAQKAGTTSLYEFLSARPRIIPNRSWKEVRFFDLPENYRQGMGWYLGNFPTRREAGNRITFDASPSYLYFPQIPGQIRRHLGSHTPMIAVLRNPAERAYSAWKMYHSFGTNPDVHETNKRIADRRSFAEAITEELADRVAPGTYPYAYVGRGMYAFQLENYYRVFDRRYLLCLDFSRLRIDAGNLLDEVTDFVGIDQFTSEQKSQIVTHRHNAGLVRGKSTEDEQTLATLREHFAPHNRRLEQLLKWKLDW